MTSVKHKWSRSKALEEEKKYTNAFREMKARTKKTKYARGYGR